MAVPMAKLTEEISLIRTHTEETDVCLGRENNQDWDSLHGPHHVLLVFTVTALVWVREPLDYFTCFIIGLFSSCFFFI